MESFSTLFATKTRAKVPPFHLLCSMILMHVHLGCDCCQWEIVALIFQEFPVHQFLYRPTSVSHCIFVSLHIYWTNSTNCVLMKLSYLWFWDCLSCSVGVVAPGKQLKSVLNFVDVKLAAERDRILLSGHGGDAVCQDCYGCSLSCEFILRPIFRYS